MLQTSLIALRLALLTLITTGLIYPIALTGVSRVLFSRASGGSLVADSSGKVVGSSLIGQAFKSPRYLQGRPSGAGASGYDAAASSGSNLGPTSAVLTRRIEDAVTQLNKANPGASDPIPVDLVTASGSGLDPHVSPAAALWQVPRIARARNVSAQRIKATIEAFIEGRDLGILGEPRVNVLRTNMALDQQFGRQSP